MSESQAKGMGEVSAAPKSGGKSAGKCPICGKPADVAARPFCGKRCADVDLARWMGGVYVIPAGVDDDEDGGQSQIVANSDDEGERG